MSEEENKKGGYEKPESKDMDGDDLEDTSGGSGDPASRAPQSTGTYTCSTGMSAYGNCQNGPTPNE